MANSVDSAKVSKMDGAAQPVLLAQAGTDPGFKLPGATDQKDKDKAPAATPPADGAASSAPIEIAPLQGAAPATDTSARELAIGGGIFLVLLVAFFFARNAFTHHLVVRRVSPSSAGSAGWLLFVGLCFLSAAALLAIINASRYLTWGITGPLVLVGAGSLIGALFVGRR